MPQQSVTSMASVMSLVETSLASALVKVATQAVAMKKNLSVVLMERFMRTCVS